MFKRVIFGEVRNPQVAELTDLNARETSILVVLALAVLALGIWPAPLLNTMHTSIDHLLEQIAKSKTTVAAYE